MKSKNTYSLVVAISFALALSFVLPCVSAAQGFGGPGEETTYQSNVDASYVLGLPMPFTLTTGNDPAALAPKTVEHPNTGFFALTLERLDGHVDERPIYEAVYDGNAITVAGSDGRIDFAVLPDEMTSLAPGESATLELDMKELFGFELIDPGTYRLSIAGAEGETPFEVTTFSITYDPVISTAYFEDLRVNGDYNQKVFAELMLAEHP